MTSRPHLVGTHPVRSLIVIIMMMMMMIMMVMMVMMMTKTAELTMVVAMTKSSWC